MLLCIQVKNPLLFEHKLLTKGNKCSCNHKFHCSDSMLYDKSLRNFPNLTIQQTIGAITNQFTLRLFSLTFIIIFQSMIIIILLDYQFVLLLPILLFVHSNKYCLHINHKYQSTFDLTIHYIYLNEVKANYEIQEEIQTKYIFHHYQNNRLLYQILPLVPQQTY